MDQRDGDDQAKRLLERPSSIVDRQLQRTFASHGITGPEIKRCSGAVRFMERYCQQRQRSGLWWLSTDKNTEPSDIADLRKRITKLQGEHGLAQYSVTVFETGSGPHAHIVFNGNRKIADRLNGSTFGQIIKVARVTDPHKLTSKYLAKERTPQAGYRRQHRLGARIKGSHKLAGGGDRVRLSRALKRDAIAAGYVQNWQPTNARRTDTRKLYQLRNSGPQARAPRPAGQLPLLPEIERPVSRLRDFGGGIVPRAVAAEIEFLRRQLGLSQRELACKIGRSQGQYANAMRGHDPISARAINRLRDVMGGVNS